MQVTNSATIVDYFPEAFVAEACDIIVDHFATAHYLEENDK